MKIKYVSEESVIEAINELNELLGFPNYKNGTLTYCDVPEPNEDGEYCIEIDNELANNLNIIIWN